MTDKALIGSIVAQTARDYAASKLVQSDALPEIQDCKAAEAAIDAVVTAKDGTKFGFSNVYLEGDRVFGRAQKTNLGNLTADANAYAARKALPSGTQVVVSLKNWCPGSTSMRKRWTPRWRTC
jgi:2',3'-cyclic-nucleotide 2'-phosphodiesterase (5'-nucleotidase family)